MTTDASSHDLQNAKKRLKAIAICKFSTTKATDKVIGTGFYALKQSNLEAYVDELKSTFDRQAYQGFIGSSLSMQAVYRIIDSVANSKATVFITGESGTGKEVCAAAIHKQSQHAGKPFIALNCAAIPREK